MTLREALEAIEVSAGVPLKVFDASVHSYDLKEIEAAPYSNSVFCTVSGLPRVPAIRTEGQGFQSMRGQIIVSLFKRHTEKRSRNEDRLKMVGEIAVIAAQVIHITPDELNVNIPINGQWELNSETEASEFNPAFAPQSYKSLNIAYWQATRFAYQIAKRVPTV